CVNHASAFTTMRVETNVPRGCDHRSGERGSNSRRTRRKNADEIAMTHAEIFDHGRSVNTRTGCAGSHELGLTRYPKPARTAKNASPTVSRRSRSRATTSNEGAGDNSAARARNGCIEDARMELTSASIGDVAYLAWLG